MSNESKRERFVRIVEARTNKILEMMRLLGNCSSKANYEYSDEDIKKIFGALEKENTPELLDDVSTETLSGALPEILKIIDLLPAVTDMQEMMSIVGCVSRVRDIGLPGKAIEESLRLAPYTRRRLSLLRLRKMLTY